MGRKSKKPTKTIALVQWYDAHADFNGSWTLESDIDPEGLKVDSVGIILDSVKPGHVSIAQSYTAGFCDHILHIPDQMVIEITVIGCLELEE